MPCCVAWNCQNRSDGPQGTSFHKFPLTRPELLELWLHNLNREPGWEPNVRSVLCSDHFLEKCFDRTGQTVRLRADALPTIFAYPEDRVQDIIETVPASVKSASTGKSGGAATPAEDMECMAVSPPSSPGGSPDSARAREVAALEHSYHGTATAAKRQGPDDREVLKKKLKMSRQRVRRLEEKVSMLNDMVYSLLNQTIMEM
ncbi:THAP domain-containing protein 1 isoform X1 [Ixodes scapularis]|nr:THAP domain-containing protein 1 isoform X1 [Ixodes scapularis]